ncbi:MAG: prolipoprotein diacylglyceryl transferase [Candidatus Hydrogenedentes bacterium]|nr:prolipoprotein diacylglyceryl transferase [Candidatus Hydrogenedentota bacterium]
MEGPFVHGIDPIIAEVGGVYLWWYGLSYSLGFLEIHLWLRRARGRLGLDLEEVYRLSILFALGVLLGGRLVQVGFYEWPYYLHHPERIPALWLGGMATHGLLLGAVVATWGFCRKSGKDFLTIADELVIPGAFLMGLGRIGNFIDGQIVGRETDIWWAVKFPDIEGFRHPVVLYDGLKNLLLIPLLVFVQKKRSTPGVVLAHFIFWYAFLRIFVDLYRMYWTELLGLATGQSFNVIMSCVGVALLIWLSRRKRPAHAATLQPVKVPPDQRREARTNWVSRIILVAILLFALTIPSNRTQDIPARYGHRHPGLHYSWLYPPLAPADK